MTLKLNRRWADPLGMVTIILKRPDNHEYIFIPDGGGGGGDTAYERGGDARRLV